MAYLVVGVVQSTTITNEHMYLKIRIRGMKGNNEVHTIWFDPVSAELRITPRTFNLSEGALESEDAVTTNLVEFLKESRLRHNQ